MPSIKFDYNISANKQINISWDVKNILPNISNVLPAYAIISNKEALQGVANINTGTTNTLSASYLYSDLIKTKLLFFVNASYSSGSILYLLNQEPSTFYIKSKNVSTSTNNKVVNLMSHISKYISNINSEIALEMAIVQNAGYCSINNIITPLEILNIIPAFKVKTILNRNIIIATGIKQTYATQFLNGVSVAKTTLLNENINCSYKISPHILFNIQYRNFVSKLSGASNSLLLCDASLKCTTAKGKLNFLVSANNIFNKSEFVFNSFTSISVATERMKILPRYFLLETTIEL
jgi:hypothetical protein